MSKNIFINALPRLEHLKYSLVVDTTTGGFFLELRPDGKYESEYDYPVKRKIFECVEELEYYIKDQTIIGIILLEHDTDEEIFLYP